MSTTNDPLQPVFIEALAIHRIFQAAGVSTDDLFVSSQTAKDGGRELLVVVVRPGSDGVPLVAVSAGRLDVPDAATFRAAWEAAVAMAKTLPAEAFFALTEATHARANAARLIAAVVTAREGSDT